MKNPTQELPEEFQAAFGLGGLTGFYTVKRQNLWVGLIFGLLFFFGGGLLLIIGLIDSLIMAERFGPAKFWDNYLLYIIFGIIALVVGIFLLVNAYIQWPRALAIFEQGFAYRDRSGFYSPRWSEIESFYLAITRHYTNGIYTGTTHQYTVNLMDGKRLVFDDSLNPVEEIGNIIEKMAFPFMLKRASDLFHADQPVKFGTITLQKSLGIVIGNKTYPWNEIQQVSLESGQFQVAKKGGGWFSGASQMVAAIPNLRVLLTLVDEAVGVKL